MLNSTSWSPNSSGTNFRRLCKCPSFSFSHSFTTSSVSGAGGAVCEDHLLDGCYSLVLFWAFVWRCMLYRLTPARLGENHVTFLLCPPAVYPKRPS